MLDKNTLPMSALTRLLFLMNRKAKFESVDGWWFVGGDLGVALASGQR